jgi:tRNA(Ile)-lysidine synthase
MGPLGPFGPAPRLAAGVSGGPHSLALAWLAAEWARARGGMLLALIVDHGLRAESRAEADAVAALLAGRGIAVQVLRLRLGRAGAGMQARAREARLAALAAAAAAAGAPWLLLGHHRGDQAETLLHRAASGSGPAGLAGMAPARALPGALLLRPLLGVAPVRLEAVVAAAGLHPVRDPSNADRRFARIRLRQALADPAGSGPEIAALAAAAAAFARRRAARQAAIAARLAAALLLHAEGWAEIDPAALGTDAVAEAALAGLLRAFGGAAAFAPAPGRVAALLRAGQGTLGGAWLRRAGVRWQLLREPAAALAAAPRPALRGAVWDGRFRLVGPGAPGCEIGALGAAEAARLGSRHRLPAAVLAGLPAIRRTEWQGAGPGSHSALAAVPGLLYPDADTAARFAMLFAPVSGPVC